MIGFYWVTQCFYKQFVATSKLQVSFGLDVNLGKHPNQHGFSQRRKAISHNGLLCRLWLHQFFTYKSSFNVLQESAFSSRPTTRHLTPWGIREILGCRHDAWITILVAGRFTWDPVWVHHERVVSPEVLADRGIPFQTNPVLVERWSCLPYQGKNEIVLLITPNLYQMSSLIATVLLGVVKRFNGGINSVTEAVKRFPVARARA